MNELKFKAYLKKENKIVDVKTIHFHTRKIMIGYSKNKSNHGQYSVNFDDIVLLQYTGLNDINNEEIYDGDILEYLDMLFLVKIDKYGILLLGDGDSTYWNRILPYVPNQEHFIIDSGNYKKVGNIFDKSELLKEH